MRAIDFDSLLLTQTSRSTFIETAIWFFFLHDAYDLQTN